MLLISITLQINSPHSASGKVSGDELASSASFKYSARNQMIPLGFMTITIVAAHL